MIRHTLAVRATCLFSITERVKARNDTVFAEFAKEFIVELYSKNDGKDDKLVAQLAFKSYERDELVLITEQVRTLINNMKAAMSFNNIDLSIPAEDELEKLLLEADKEPCQVSRKELEGLVSSICSAIHPPPASTR